MSVRREVLRRQVADALALPPEELRDDEDLTLVGMDSIRVMALVEAWRAEHGVEIGFMELAERPTLAGWDTLLERAIAATPGA